MTKQLSRETIRRMMDGIGGNATGTGGGGGGGGEGMASQQWVEGNYVSKAFFLRLFVPHASNSSQITPNDMDTALSNIEAKADFWSEGAISALGLGSGGGGGGVSALSDLTDVLITSPSDGEVLMYDSDTGLWKNGTVGGGGGGSGTVTKVAMTVPTGLLVSGSPITGSGTLAVTFASGYSIPKTSKQSNWDTAYGWGDHSQAGYLTQHQVVAGTFWGKAWSNGGIVNGDINAGGNGGAILAFHSIELNTEGTLSGNGGIIDFHFPGGASDYTTRISEDQNGRLYIDASQGVRIGNGVLVWDSTNNALKVQKSDGTSANLYATGGVSALGMSAGVSSVDAMTFGYLTVTNQINLGGSLISNPGSGNLRIAANTILYLDDSNNTYVDVYGYMHSPRFYVGGNRYIYLDGTTLKYYDNGTEKTIQLT